MKEIFKNTDEIKLIIASILGIFMGVIRIIVQSESSILSAIEIITCLIFFIPFSFIKKKTFGICLYNSIFCVVLFRIFLNVTYVIYFIYTTF